MTSSPELDIDTIMNDIPAANTGVHRLWLAVTLHAIQALKSGKNVGSARTFIMDPENPFVEAVCGGLGISPDALRERVEKKGVEKQ